LERRVTSLLEYAHEAAPAAASLGSSPFVPLLVTGIFAGIGGLETGFRRAGHIAVMLCESDPAARRVLSHHFPHVELTDNVRKLRQLPPCDVVTAGFPCQDLSQVGMRNGIGGKHSKLINHVISLLRDSKSPPTWLVLENVPFMLRLHRGAAIRKITRALERMGWAWAYRTVDTHAFGLPQRRRRVILLASPVKDPRPALLGEDVGEPRLKSRGNHACGFYWTEGNRGLGWAVDATPPLKGGSSIAIPSPPAIWFPRRRTFLLPSLEDAERLQGFSPGWTERAELEPNGHRQRWRLVGNAVSVPVAQWLGERLNTNEEYDGASDDGLKPSAGWPAAAWGVGGHRGHANVSSWPVNMPSNHLASFLQKRVRSLSLRAAGGFLSRLEESSLRVEASFLRDLRRYVRRHAQAIQSRS